MSNDPQQPVGAVIEIIERRPAPSGPPSIGDDCIVPNDIRINGQSLLCPQDNPVRVHGITIGGDELVQVTLTLFAKRIFIGAEEPSATSPAGRASKVWGASKEDPRG